MVAQPFKPGLTKEVEGERSLTVFNVGLVYTASSRSAKIT